MSPLVVLLCAPDVAGQPDYHLVCRHQLLLNPLDDSNDPLASSLTVTTHPWIEGLLRNFNYHLEHHVFPA